MPPGVVLLPLFVLLVLVDMLAAVSIGTTTAVDHSHDHLGSNKKDTYNYNNQQKSPSFTKQDAEKFAKALAKGFRSFATGGGRGKYKLMAKEFLDAHNRVRSQYGVPPLRWSGKLARYARRWSSARRYDCVMMHSENSPYGENVFQGSGRDWRPVNVVADWASEASFYDWRAQECHPGQECGHFTSMVWRTTKYVGCGRSDCYDGGSFFTCSYDPPGNWKGEVPLT
ncbi:unnamed protein product [Alopecurus aequalis]